MHGSNMLLGVLEEREKTFGSLRSDSLTVKAYIIQQHFACIDRLTSVFHPHFTLHDMAHSEGVACNLYEICRRASLLDCDSQYGLSNYELFYLIAAAFLHDVGMVVLYDDDTDKARAIVNDENPVIERTIAELVRDEHHLRSAEYISRNKKYLFLDDLEASVIGAICKGHRKLESLTKSDYGDRPAPDRSTIRVRLLTSLLRIADELDLDYRRAPEIQRKLIEKGKLLDRVSRLHWVKHYHTAGITFGIRTNKVKFITLSIFLQAKDDFHCKAVERLIVERLNEEIKDIEPFIAQAGIAFELQPTEYLIDESFEKTMWSKNDINILIVDDIPAQVSTLQDFLCEAGFVVDYAEDCGSGFKKILENPERFQLSIIDLDMADFSNTRSPEAGIELLNAIRHIAPKTINFIHTYIENDTNITKKALQSGATDYLVKGETTHEDIVRKVIDSLNTSYLMLDEGIAQ